jgi:hypothetical protein
MGIVVLLVFNDFSDFIFSKENRTGSLVVKVIIALILFSIVGYMIREIKFSNKKLAKIVKQEKSDSKKKNLKNLKNFKTKIIS